MHLFTQRFLTCSIFLLFFLIHFQFAFAQKEIIQSNQQWAQYYLTAPLNESFSIITDGGFRWKNQLSDPSQYIYRIGLAYQLKENLRLAAGMAHLGFYQGREMNRIEFRPYQEFIVVQNWAKWESSQRFRLEERFFRGLEDNTSDGFNLRFRYRLSFSFPIWHDSKTNSGRAMLINIANEIFLNTGKEIVYNVFDQNRFIIGPAFQITPNLTIKALYNYDFLSNNSPGKFRSVHVIWFTISQTLNFSR